MKSTSAITRDSVREVLEAFDCPRALAVWLMYEYGEHKQLASLDFNPLDYNEFSSARDSLAATKLLSKATFLETGNNLKKEAHDSFIAAEAQCRSTNRRILRGQYKNTATQTIILMMAWKIGYTLGEIDPEAFVDYCNWGPGASTSIKRRNATAPTKFQSATEITSAAYDFVAPWFSAVYPSWDFQPKIVEASKVVTVPKNAKTDRTIAIEPDLNLWFQKGIGALLRRKLRRAGIDLNSQDHNARLSRTASKFNDLATVDFSSASDTISKELVAELLPRDWFSLCWAFRSSYALFDGKPLRLEKFSSMGNGFTFELESLIFWALAVACCDYLGLDSSSISVFGDDVIIPSGAFDLFAVTADDLGFTVNGRKSFSSTYYRESCGDHYWNGLNVKPIFLKEPLDGKTSILKFANSIRRLAHRRNSFYGCDARLLRAWQTLADSLGPKAPRISDGYGDIALVCNQDEADSRVIRASRGYEGFFVNVWVARAIKREFDGRGLLLTKLKSISQKRDLDYFDIPDLGCSGNELPLPMRTVNARTRVHVPRWIELGPWL